jgi:hypothetical protein
MCQVLTVFVITESALSSDTVKTGFFIFMAEEE